MKNDGGPAFPTGIESFDGPQRTVQHFPGLTKRELFAGMAMAGLLANPILMQALSIAEKDVHKAFSGYPLSAVELADALLAELKK